MRYALLIVLFVSFSANCVGDEKEKPTATPPVNSSDSTLAAKYEDLLKLLAEVKQLKDRISAVERASQQVSSPYLAAPQTRDVLAPPVGETQRGFALQPPPPFSPVPPARSDVAPEPAQGLEALHQASKPRVAQETARWQRLELDGKVYYVVPETDVLQSGLPKQTRY